ncbi:hypothetical protein GGR54DRAFT_107615 [Hypoxylon sp. NC1633]|nr:hypothetical protein GGR54DRAFT_107615 [Hypoxylon sp. NC1633]
MTNPPVPRTTEVIPGATVNIVLKADQRTGREVSGTVRDVLTRGDHHRGIKVRLTDGRIGRVQSIGSTPSRAPSSGSVGVGLANNPAPPTDEATDSMNGDASYSRGRRARHRDTRLEEPLEVAPKQAELSAYIVPSRRKGKNRSGPKETGQLDGPARSNEVSGSIGDVLNSAGDVTSATATCPVCGEFEGDETAVAHHVAEHFE